MAGRFTKGKLSRIHELWLNRWFLRWLLRTSEGEGLSHKVVTRQSLRILPSPIYFSTFAIFRDQRCLMRKIWTRRQLDERWKFNLNICLPVFSANGDNIYIIYIEYLLTKLFSFSQRIFLEKVDIYDVQAAETLSEQTLQEYKDIFSFFDR